MPWNGSGTFNLDPSFSPEVNGTVIDATRYNGLTSDIASGITVALTKDGQNAATADIPMGGFTLSGLGPGTAPGESVRYEQVDLVGESTLPAAATTSIFAGTNQIVALTGNTGITSLGTNTTGQVRLVYSQSGGPVTFTYNVTSLIIPGAVNLTLNTGDYALIRGLGGTNAQVIQVMRGSSLILALSALSAATVANTLANGTATQTWGWVPAAPTDKGMVLTQTDASNTQGILFTLTGGGLSLFRTISSLGATLVDVKPNSISIGGTQTASNAGTTTVAGIGTSSGTAGDLMLVGGAGTSGPGGTATLKGGVGGSAGSAVMSDSTGAVTVTTSPTALTLKTTGVSGADLVFDARRVNVDNSAGTPSILSGGGAGPTILGSDFAFQVTIGVGGAANVTVQYALAFPTAPEIVIVGGTGASSYSYSASNVSVQLNFSPNLAAGAKVSCLLMRLI